MAEAPISPFDAYGIIASLRVSDTVQAGRLAGQEAAEGKIPDDVAQKLDLQAHHSLLDIGCGPGALLSALADKVSKAVGIDHPSVIARARATCGRANVRFLEGRFPDVEVDESFDRIVIYSVLQYLQDSDAVVSFIDAAVALLAPGGKLLVGDIVNANMKTRFLDSDAGRAFHAGWSKNSAEMNSPASEQVAKILNDTVSVGALNDVMVLDLVRRYRQAGLNAFVLPQSEDLPFGRTREDLLIVRL